MAKAFLSAISCYPGAMGSPGLYLGSDTTTGIYRIGANNLGVTISGSKVLDIASTGLTVVGVISVTGTTKTNGAFYAGSTSPDNTTRLNYDGAFWSTSLNAGTYLSMGGGATITPANYGTFGVNNHGSLLFTSNLYMNNGAFKVANTHATMAGAAMLVPGNGQTRQGFFEFWTTPTGAVTADAAFTPTVPNFTVGTAGNIGINTAKKFFFDGINLAGNTYIWESGTGILDIYAGGTNTLKLATTGITITGTAIVSGSIKRSASTGGYLDGQYSSVETVSTPGVIYTIGGSYQPTSTTTGTIYGVGYGYSGANGITATNAPNNKWGFYVASAGTSRIFLNSDDGNIYVNGAYYGAGTGLTGTAASLTSGISSTVTLTADNSTNATNYPLFVNAATGNLSPRTDTGFTYNPSTGDLTTAGTLYASAKSFKIDHPTKPGKKLVHGSLEGPENGVYIRGRTQSSVIHLPEYWTELVDSESITVQLTAVGRGQKLYVEFIAGNKVYIANNNFLNHSIDCYYFIQAERKDVSKIEVEQ